jgi:chromosome partitioning protein
MPAITISVINEKGGVGKTTTVACLGGCYARNGKATLLIDNDPQASLTRGLVGSVETDQIPREQTLAALFDEDFYAYERIVQPTAFDNLFLVPGSRAMKALNRLDPAAYGPLQFRLRELVNEVAGRFERILIDNPPNLEFCTWAALTASRFVLTPLQAEDYGSQGIRFVAEAVALVQQATNPGLRQLGFVRTLFQKRAAVHVAYSQAIADAYPGMLLENYMPYATQYREAIVARAPVSFYKPRVEAAKAVARIVEEVERRIASLSGAGSTTQEARRVA